MKRFLSLILILGLLALPVNLYAWDNTAPSNTSNPATEGPKIRANFQALDGTSGTPPDKVYAMSGFDVDGAADLDIGSSDVLDITFTTDDCTIIFDGGITISTGDIFKIGTKQWSSGDEFDGTKIKDADYGDVTINAAGAWDVENAQTVTTNANLTGVVTSTGNATAIADKALAIAKLADGTDGQLITWNASGVIATVATGTATHVLTSGGTGVAPTFQAAAGGGDDFNGFLIGTDGDYTTIQAALDAQNSGGEQFYISEGATYTEAVTFTADNQSIIGQGNRTNTIITQVAARAVNFSTYAGCTLANVTVSVSAADGTSDECVYSNNDNATGLGSENIIENCIIDWDSATALSNTSAIDAQNGDIIVRDCIITVTDTQSNNTASGVGGIRTAAAHTTHIYDNVIDVDNSTTAASGLDYGIQSSGLVEYIYDNTITVDSAGATNHITRGIRSTGASGKKFIIGNTMDIDSSSTAKADGFYSDGASSLNYLTGNTIDVTAGDSDGKWINNVGGTTYTHGNTVTGDGQSVNSATTHYGSDLIDGTVENGTHTAKVATATEAGAMFWDGIVIGTDSDDFIIDNSTHGSSAGAVYLGNATIDATFTGFHYYELGDTDLQMGEVVKLVDAKLYRSDTLQDPKVIGIYCGLTNWKDSFGTKLVDSKEVEEEYDEWDKEKKKYIKKIKKYKNHGHKVNAITGDDVQPLDYAYSVAVVGDSMHENMNNPLEGAWTCDLGGIIKNGDYLCSSSKVGFLQKQTDNIMYNYTIAKAREDIVFDENGENKTSYIYLLQ